MLPDVAKVLVSLPHVHVTHVKVFVDGEDDIKEQDLVSVTARVTLTRASHAGAELGSARRGGGGAVQVYAPKFPHPVTEKWCVSYICSLIVLVFVSLVGSTLFQVAFQLCWVSFVVLCAAGRGWRCAGVCAQIPAPSH